MSEIKLIFVRHGEAANAWGSHKDPGLSSNGLEQAKSILENAELQSLEKFDFISSPKTRAIETSKPLAAKFQKKISIDEIFDEIPSKGIPNDIKQDWLRKIITMDKRSLPSEIKRWDDEIYKRVISFQNNSIIFCHFMVINSILSNLTKSETILYFHPDYVSITKIVLENSKVTSFETPGSKKTYVNI